MDGFTHAEQGDEIRLCPDVLDAGCSGRRQRAEITGIRTSGPPAACKRRLGAFWKTGTAWITKDESVSPCVSDIAIWSHCVDSVSSPIY